MNFLIVMSFIIMSYDIYIHLKKDIHNNININNRLFILNLIFCTAIIVKFTNILLVLPILIFLYIFIFKKIKINIKLLFYILIPFVLFILFFIRHFILYNNPIFPSGLSIFGSGPFDYNMLKISLGHLVGSKIGASRDIFGLLLSPLLYIKDGIMLMNPNPLFWIFAFLGFFHLIKNQFFYAVIGILVCYILAFFKLPHYFIRFYLGCIDFLIVLGIVEFIKIIPLKWKEISNKLLKFAIYTCSVAILLATVIYSKQFISFFFSNQNKDLFIKPRIECYDTIKWINKNLPEDSLLVVTTRGRYYYDVSTELLHPTAFGKDKLIIQNNKNFYLFLKEKGVTHLMIRERSGKKKSKSPYRIFCENPKFTEKIYSNNNEIVMGYRNKTPLYGKTAIYKLR